VAQRLPPLAQQWPQFGQRFPQIAHQLPQPAQRLPQLAPNLPPMLPPFPTLVPQAPIPFPGGAGMPIGGFGPIQLASGAAPGMMPTIPPGAVMPGAPFASAKPPHALLIPPAPAPAPEAC